MFLKWIIFNALNMCTLCGQYNLTKIYIYIYLQFKNTVNVKKKLSSWANNMTDFIIIYLNFKLRIYQILKYVINDLLGDLIL